MKNNSVERVILIHDIASSNRIGMQDYNSRYLISWNIFFKAVEEAEKR